MRTPSNQAPNTMASKKKVFGMIQAFWESQCVYVATRLGIPNLLQKGQQSVESLAASTSTNVEKLYLRSCTILNNDLPKGTKYERKGVRKVQMDGYGNHRKARPRASI